MLTKPFKCTLKDLRASPEILSNIYGEEASKLLQDCFDKFVNQFKVQEDIQVLGPTIEGVGQYPDIDMNL